MVFYLGRKNKKGRSSKRLGFVMRTSRKGDRILSILDDIKKEENEKNDLLEEQAIEEKAQNIYTTIEELSKKVKQEPIHKTEKDAPVNVKELDSLFADAARLIVRKQSGSTSLLQRMFSIGYNRSGRLMDQIEKAGIVSPAQGSKPREVLISDETTLDNLLSTLH